MDSHARRYQTLPRNFLTSRHNQVALSELVRVDHGRNSVRTRHAPAASLSTLVDSETNVNKEQGIPRLSEYLASRATGAVSTAIDSRGTNLSQRSKQMSASTTSTIYTPTTTFSHPSTGFGAKHGRTAYHHLPRWIRTRITLYATGIPLQPLPDLRTTRLSFARYELAPSDNTNRNFFNMTRAEKNQYILAWTPERAEALKVNYFQDPLDLLRFLLFHQQSPHLSHITDIELDLWLAPPLHPEFRFPQADFVDNSIAWEEVVKCRCAEWERAMLKLPRSVAQVVLHARIPLTADWRGIQVMLERIMTIAYFRTRGGAKLLTDWIH